MCSIIPKNNYVAVGNEKGLLILDVINEDNQKEIAFLDIRKVTSIDLSKENLLMLISKENGLFIFDISDPKGPIYVGGYYSKIEGYDLSVSGNLAFVADGDNGLVIFHFIGSPPSQGNIILCPSGPASMVNTLWSPSQQLSNLA